MAAPPDGFSPALNRTINNYANEAKLLKEAKTGCPARISERVVCGRIGQGRRSKVLQSGQGQLVSSEVATAVSTVVADKLGQYLERHPKEARK